MHYISLIKSILDEIEFQIVQSIRDLSTNLFHEKLTFHTRNVHETLTHLIDVCYAYQYLREGKKYKWDSFTTDQVSKEEVFPMFLKVWKETCSLAYQVSTEKEFTDAIEYLALHTAYHIGQICTLRMNIDPNWDAKSIYKHNKGKLQNLNHTQ